MLPLVTPGKWFSTSIVQHCTIEATFTCMYLKHWMQNINIKCIHNKIQELSTGRIQIKWLIKGIYGNKFCCFYACDGHTLPHLFYTCRRFFVFSFYFVTLRDVFVRSSWIFFFSSSLRSRSSSIFSRSWTVTLSLLQNKYALAFCLIAVF